MTLLHNVKQASQPRYINADTMVLSDGNYVALRVLHLTIMVIINK
jgi:hypothetical protein